MELVAVLVRIQQARPKRERSDAAFAATLGIPRSTWQRYKMGSPLTLNFVQRAYEAYPQVKPQIDRLIFGSNAKKDASRTTKAQRRAS